MKRSWSKRFLGLAAMVALATPGIFLANVPRSLALPRKPLPQHRAVSKFCTRFEQLALERDLPLRVTQCESQRGAGKRALVVQSDDPIAIMEDEIDSGDLPDGGDEVEERAFLGPLRAYRDAVKPGESTLLPHVDYLILAFRDAKQTVFEISPRLMRRYIRGELDDQGFVDSIRISGI